MRKTKEDAKITRQSLLDAALVVFYKKGVSKATVANIAKEAGVTRGALYWHFKNKDEVFTELTKQFMATDKQMLETVINSEHIWEQLHSTFQDFFTHLGRSEQQQQFISIFFQIFDMRDPTNIVRILHDDYDKMWKTYIHEGIRRAKKSGELPADLDMNWAFFQLGATVTGLMKMLIGRTAEDSIPEKYVAHILEQTFSLIAQAPVQTKNMDSHEEVQI